MIETHKEDTKEDMERFQYLSKGEINEIPKTPGVYSFLSSESILYIGKAANLRARVKNHFAQPSYRDNLFRNQVSRVGYIETQSEIDALLLESQLIKTHQPKYNVMWKDGKNYFYVGMTKEKLPRVFLTHQPTNESPELQTKNYKLKTEYVGPFVEGKAIKEALRLLRRVFPYYTQKNHPQKPCSWCHLNLCPGPKPNIKIYKKDLQNLILVLRGKRVSVLKKLKRDMAQLAKQENFEEAAVLRNQIFALEKIIAHTENTQKTLQKIFKTKKEITRIEAYDISNMQGKEATGSMVTFINEKPAKNWYRRFRVHISGSPNDFAMLEETITRRLNHPEWPYPDLMIIDGGKGQLSSATEALDRTKNYKLQTKNVRVAAIAKRNNELFLPGKSTPIMLKNLPQSVQNVILHIRDEAHRFAITYHKKLRRVDLFYPK